MLRRAAPEAAIKQREQVSDTVGLPIVYRGVDALKGLAEPRVRRRPIGEIVGLNRCIARNRLKLCL